jgi:hypothetical protein
MIEGFAGVTAIDTSGGGVTVRTVEPPTPSGVALMVLVPAPIPVARPAALIGEPVVMEIWSPNGRASAGAEQRSGGSRN